MWIKDRPYSVDFFFLIFKKPLIKCRKQDYCKSFLRMELKAFVLCWIADFLSDRKMRIMFLIYVNDIPEIVNCSIKMFADDTKLFRTVINH